MCSTYLTHHLRLVAQHAREVHHLAQHTDIVAGHQLLHPGGIDHGPAGLDVGRTARHATGRGKAEVERGFPTRLYHIVDTLDTQHVADLVGVGHHADGAVTGCQMGKLARRHHTALDMHVAVDETGHQERPRLPVVGQSAAFHLPDAITLDRDFAIIHLAANHVDDMSLIFLHGHAIQFASSCSFFLNIRLMLPR